MSWQYAVAAPGRSGPFAGPLFVKGVPFQKRFRFYSCVAAFSLRRRIGSEDHLQRARKHPTLLKFLLAVRQSVAQAAFAGRPLYVSKPWLGTCHDKLSRDAPRSFTCELCKWFCRQLPVAIGCRSLCEIPVAHRRPSKWSRFQDGRAQVNITTSRVPLAAVRCNIHLSSKTAPFVKDSANVWALQLCWLSFNSFQLALPRIFCIAIGLFVFWVALPPPRVLCRCHATDWANNARS